MTVVSPILVALAVAVLVVAAVAVVLAVVAVSQFVVSNRRERLARQESIRTYYHRGPLVTH